jgi:hypothetical protein
MRDNQIQLQKKFTQQIRDGLGSAAVAPCGMYAQNRQVYKDQLPELPISEILSFEGGPNDNNYYTNE